MKEEALSFSSEAEEKRHKKKNSPSESIVDIGFKSPLNRMLIQMVRWWLSNIFLKVYPDKQDKNLTICSALHPITITSGGGGGG